MKNSDVERMLTQFLALRRAVGILGILLPFWLLLGGYLWAGCPVQDSISDYYHTGMRDWFVGILFAIGLFLFSYKGHDKQDDVCGHVAFMFAMGVAVFPNRASTQTLHFACAAGLFLVLSYFSLVLFTKSGEERTQRKEVRNTVYKVCGGVMLVCMALIGAFHAFLQETWVAEWKPVFLLETAMLSAFGFSWITKGEALLKDTEPQA